MPASIPSKIPAPSDPAVLAHLDMAFAALEKELSQPDHASVVKDQNVLDFIQNQGIPIPSLDDIDSDLSQSANELELIPIRLETLAAEHQRNLQMLNDKYVGEYQRAATHRYNVIQGVLNKFGIPHVLNDRFSLQRFEERLAEKYDEKFDSENAIALKSWEKSINDEQEAYKERVSVIVRRRVDLDSTKAVTAARTMPRFKFPRSIKEFKNLPLLQQVYVANYLSGTKAKADQIGKEQAWSWEVNKLKHAYENDNIFKAEIGSVSLQASMQPTKDPRKR